MVAKKAKKNNDLMVTNGFHTLYGKTTEQQRNTAEYRRSVSVKNLPDAKKRYEEAKKCKVGLKVKFNFQKMSLRLVPEKAPTKAMALEYTNTRILVKRESVFQKFLENE